MAYRWIQGVPHRPFRPQVLRELEKRQLVKAVKSVASGASNRKVYMAYGVEPAREITGGAWCALWQEPRRR
jgi:DNA-directed RNA polymerase III subunit RPC6